MNYKIRFTNPQQHFRIYGKEYMTVLKDRLSKGEFILRKDVSDFEKKLAEMCGTKYAIGVNSGFDALLLSMEAAGIKRDDRVITVAHTFLATLSAIVKLGATPVLIDIGEDWNMDVSLIENAITKRTKAIIPVHLNGRMCDMDAIMNIATKHNLIVIEDACQSLTARFKGKSAGSWGLTGCFSFYPFKILGAFGEAGAITTNDSSLAERLIYLRYHGVDRTPERNIRTYGWNAVLDNIQATVLNIKLKYFSQWVNRRREIANLYHNGLSGIRDLKLPHFPQKQCYDVYQNYVIQTKDRDTLKMHLLKKGVETIISWPIPLYRYPELSLPNTPLPLTEKASREVLSLPLYPELTNREVSYVITSTLSFFRKS